MANKIPKSIRKRIRQEKAKIRSEVSDEVMRQEAIKKLYEKFGFDRPVENKEQKPE